MKQITNEDILQWERLVKLIIQKHFYANDILDEEDLYNIGLTGVWKALINYDETIDKGNGVANIKSYMYRSIYNNIIQSIKCRDSKGKGLMRAITTSLDMPTKEDSDDTLLNTIPSDVDIFDEVERKYYSNLNIVHKVINNMNKEDKELIQLRLKGFKFREMSEITNIKRSTIAMRYKRIINDIKTNIKETGYVYE